MGGVTGLMDLLPLERLAATAEAAAGVPGSAVARPVLPVAVDVALAGEGLARPFLDPRATFVSPATGQQFSSVARLIASVLDAAGEPAADAAAPLASAAAEVDARSLAPRLQHALASSGLFYESHLAALAGGQVDRADLASEPQARWSHDADRHAAKAGPSAGDAVAPPLRALVARQLEALATGVVTWRGEAWPGAAVEWQVREEGRDRQQPAGDATRCWSTTVTIAAPRLGTVDIRLSLAGTALHANVRAAAAAAAPLREAAAELREALAGAGFDAAAMAVHVAGASS